MDDMDLETMLALQEEEEERLAREEEEEDLDVLRAWEAEAAAKENKFKKTLFTDGVDGSVTNSAAKRPRETSGEPLAEKVNNLDDSLNFEALPDSPESKKARKESPLRAGVENVLDQEEPDAPSLVLRRVPSGDFQAVTTSTGDRFYLRRKPDEEENDKNQEVAALPSLTSGGGLCGVPYRELFESALAEHERISSVTANADVQEGPAASAVNEQLWVEKYRPRSYMELLSDDGTNRSLLYWLKLWDKIVFNREVKKRKRPAPPSGGLGSSGGKFSKKPASLGQKNKEGNQSKLYEEEEEEEVDENGRPKRRAALLHGPPGLGKTTVKLSLLVFSDVAYFYSYCAASKDS